MIGIVLMLLFLAAVGWLFDAISGPAEPFPVVRIKRSNRRKGHNGH